MSITRQESVIHTAGGLDRLRDAVAEQLARRGKRFDPVEYHQIVACPYLGRRIAAAYQRAPVIASAAVRAYEALRTETNRQYRLLTEPLCRGGLGFCVTFVQDDPYNDVTGPLADLDAGRLFVWSTAACGNRHPLLSDADNDRFRAVHDAFGHGGTGRGFDVHGEEAAWLLVSSQGEVDHAAWGGIHGLAVRASRMASMGRRPWLRALTR